MYMTITSHWGPQPIHNCNEGYLFRQGMYMEYCNWNITLPEQDMKL